MKNTVFTIRPKPLSEESFWSYLHRLADQNGIQLLTVLNYIKTWERKYIQRADFGLLDMSPGSVVDIERLSTLTGYSVQELLRTTFHPLLTRFGVSEDVQRSRFMSGLILDTYRFCPLCLKKTQYYRLLWKIGCLISCVEHNVYLVDTCLNCNKQISFRDVELLSVCPHCGFSLIKSQARAIDDGEREKQQWINEALCTLLEPDGLLVEPPEVAIRILYLLCRRRPHFERQMAEEALPSVLPTLLQHARDSLSKKRTLHLSFLLNILFDNRLSMKEFLQTTVPNTFVDSVRQSMVRRVEQLSCLAPWCDRHQKQGTLVKTGTTLKRRKSGETLLYYLACTECGCEYAIDNDGELKERSYFIEGYQALKDTKAPLSGIKELARRIGFTEDKTRRCLAFFSTRLHPDEWRGTRVEFDASLLERVLNDIRKGKKLKVIQQWDCWESYQQFLVYRFHSEVMRVLTELKRHRPSKRSDSAVKREKVREAVEGLLESDKDIKIAAVCDIVGVCPETIRHWGCNDFIAKAKQLQWEQRTQSRKDGIYEKVETYLSSNPTTVVTSHAVYNMLGTQRTVLWRIAPELTAYIHERIVQHNREINSIVDS
ncbi:TniQ family protein [Brevibacillus centrosporus]|uniref:TniQ family protein n=1 Tax=Brevibacillus centrosporus TaxID=54910 RepID=UPI003D1F9067